MAAEPKTVTEDAKIDLFEDDDEFEEFEINEGPIYCSLLVGFNVDLILFYFGESKEKFIIQLLSGLSCSQRKNIWIYHPKLIYALCDSDCSLRQDIAFEFFNLKILFFFLIL